MCRMCKVNVVAAFSCDRASSTREVLVESDLFIANLVKKTFKCPRSNATEFVN